MLPRENQNLLQFKSVEIQLQRPVDSSQLMKLSDQISKIVSIDREDVQRLVYFMQGSQKQVCLHKKRRRYNFAGDAQLELICFCGREDIQVS